MSAETCLTCGRTYADAYSYDEHVCIDLSRVAYASLTHDCHEEVARRGIVQPCNRPAVAVRIDSNEESPYPVCRTHVRGPMVPLPAIADAIMTTPEGGSR